MSDPTSPENGMALAHGPDFICIGAEKGGTGWLYDQLSAHPSVWMPPVKELHYFGGRRGGGGKGLRRKAAGIMSGDSAPLSQLGRRKSAERRELTPRDRMFLEHALTKSKLPSDIGWYAQLFSAKGTLTSGEITPAYSKLKEPEISRICAHFPHLKVIFLARDPVDRFWSAANMWGVRRPKKAGKAAADLSNWADVERLLNSSSAIARSYPSATARRWTAHVPPGQFFLGFFDDLAQKPTELRARIFAFLGLEPLNEGPISADFNRKASHQKAPLSNEIRARLVEHFHQEYVDAATVLGGPAEKWLERQQERLGSNAPDLDKTMPRAVESRGTDERQAS